MIKCTADKNLHLESSILPNSPEAWFHCGVTATEQCDYINAEICYRKVLALAPNSLEAMLNLGYTLNAQGRNEEALECYDSVLTELPDCAEARYNRAVYRLRRGEYLSGFTDYEFRFAAKREIDTRTYSQPLWDGSPLNGRSILVYCEQGLGDALMFSRYIPLLAELGGRVVLEVQQPLVSLMASLPGVAQIIEKTSSLPVTDCYIRLLSLPHLLQTTVETLPGQAPYLTAPAHAVAAWQRRIEETGNGYRIGLVWAGKQLPYPNRSCPPTFLTPLLSLSGTKVFSLQIGDSERFQLPETFTEKIIDLTADIGEFADTAALIANLDLVITIDTAVAHLAGALGKPVWLMLPFVSDWRWMDKRSDSPWYPTMRLFRQHAEGDWHSVVTAIVRELQNQLRQPEKDLSGLKQMDIQTCYDLGVQLKENGELITAAECFHRIIDHAPDLPDPHHALGVVLQLQGHLQEAIKQYRRATALDPDFTTSHYNLADALSKCGLYQEAIVSVRAAIRCDPAYADAHWLLGMLLLRNGDFHDGWIEYEWRWKSKRFRSKIPELGRPLWDGSPLAGRTLLIHMEQGRGDMIQFVRYAPLAAATGGRVIVCSVPELVPLLSIAKGVNLAVDRNGPLPDFDVHIPVVSLPFLFKTTRTTIPNKVPYLFPHPIKAAEWRTIIPPTTHLKVALTWAGQGYPDPNRSIPLAECLPLFTVPGIELFPLQFEKGSEELETFPEDSKVRDYTKRISDFADTAALISNLDLIISVDTAVAHLAGGMGKQTWLLLPFVSDWRWQFDQPDSPWYPTMKIFRQASPGDWTGVINQVQAELTRLSSEVEFYIQRGIELLHQDLAAEAEKAFSTAISIDPNNAEAYCSRGVALDAQHKYEEALTSYRVAITLRPDHVPAFFNMGNSCHSLGNLAAAISCYERVLTLAPDFVPTLLCLGELYKGQGNYARGEEYFVTAIKVDPNNVYAWQGLGDSQHCQEKFANAIHSYLQVLALEPSRAGTFNRMGLSYHHAGQFNEAEECFLKAQVLTPDDPALLNNLGTLLHSQERVDEEIALYRQLLTRDPSFVEGHWNLSLALLTKGEFFEGWQEYEWRFKKNSPVLIRDYHQPRWDGTPLNGKTILLHSEQGFGDTIQFARYAPLVTELGGKVVIECQAVVLKRLLCSLSDVDVVVSGDPLPRFDCHLPLLSLPLIFNTSLQSIPARIPYLSPNHCDVETWRLRLGPAKGLRIGLVWFGRQNLILNRKRSCPLRNFEHILSMQHVEFYSLQVGEGREQLSESSCTSSIIDYSDKFVDFAETAAFIMNLDLVITVDTAVAHLAGALGISTWTLLPFGADWRWQQQRLDSPWYPTMRLFRQPTSGDWHSVMQEVQEALLSAEWKVENRRNILLD